MEFLPIRAYDNYVEANMKLSMLQDEDIVCYLKDEYTLTIDPLLNIALGGMKLMVHNVQFDRAGAILEKAEAGYLQTITCPHCGKNAIHKVTEAIVYKGLASKLRSILVSGFLQKQKSFYRCSNCRQTFRHLPSPEL